MASHGLMVLDVCGCTVVNHLVHVRSFLISTLFFLFSSMPPLLSTPSHYTLLSYSIFRSFDSNTPFKRFLSIGYSTISPFFFFGQIWSVIFSIFNILYYNTALDNMFVYLPWNNTWMWMHGAATNTKPELYPENPREVGHPGLFPSFPFSPSLSPALLPLGQLA